MAMDQSALLELLEALKQPEQWTRDMARQLLNKKTEEKETIDAIAIESKAAVASKDDSHHVLELLWLGLYRDIKNIDLIQLSQQSKDPGVRTASVRMHQHYIALLQKHFIAGREPSIKKMIFKNYMSDPFPRVRLEAVRALAALKVSDNLLVALSVLTNSMDRFLDYALWLTVRELEPQWVPAFREGKLKFDEHGNVCLGFGKYAGWSLENIGRSDPGYLQWLMTKAELPSSTMAVMRAALERAEQ